MQQVHKGPGNHCCFELGAKMSYKSPEGAEQHMRMFLPMAFVGNDSGTVADLAVETLFGFDARVSQTLFTERGGNTKRAKTMLCANMCGSSHMVISPMVFQILGDAPKQVCHNVFTKVVTHTQGEVSQTKGERARCARTVAEIIRRSKQCTTSSPLTALQTNRRSVVATCKACEMKGMAQRVRSSKSGGAGRHIRKSPTCCTLCKDR